MNTLGQYNLRAGLYMNTMANIPYSGYFSGGKIFVKIENLWSRALVGVAHCNYETFLYHENHGNITPRKLPAIR